MEDATSRDVLYRLIEATKFPNEASLAVFLGISPQAIYQARKKGLVPHSWAIKVAENYGVSLDWLILGRGSMKLEETALPNLQSPGKGEAELERRVADMEEKNRLLEKTLAAKEETLGAYKELLRISQANLTEARARAAGEGSIIDAPVSAPSAPLLDLTNDED